MNYHKRNRRATISGAACEIIVLEFSLFLCAQMLVCGQPNNNTVDWHLKAQDAIRHGKLDVGAAYLRKSMAIYPQHIPTTLDLAQVLQKQGRHAEAVLQYKRVLEIDPDNIPALLELADIESWQVRTRTEAIKLLRHAISLKPGDKELHYKLARIASWDPQNRPTALKELHTIVAKYPEDSRALLLLARVLNWCREPVESEKYYGKYLSLKSTDVSARIELAQMLESQLNKRAEAANEYKRVLVLNPNNRIAKYALLPHKERTIKPPHGFQEWYAKAINDYKKGYVDSAVIALQKAHSLCPDNLPTLLELGKCYCKKGMTSQAISVYKHVLKFDQNNIVALNNLARMSSWHRENRRETIILLKRLVALKPNDLSVRWLLAKQASYEPSERKESIRQLTVLLSQPGSIPEQRLLLARLLNWQGDLSEAEKQYRLYLCEIPISSTENRQARFELAMLLSYQSAKREEAIPIFESLLKDNPADFKVGIAKARTYAWLKHYSLALDYFEHYLPSKTDNEDILHDYISALKEAGRLELAADKARELYVINPKNLKNKLQLASIYSALGEWDKAQLLFAELLQVSSCSKELNLLVSLEYARYLSRQDRLAETIAVYRNLLGIADLPLEMVPSIKLELAGTLLREHCWREAAELASDVVALNPSNGNALALLSGAYLAGDQVEKAEHVYARLKPQDLDLPQVKLLAAQLAFKLGEYKKSSELFSSILHDMSISSREHTGIDTHLEAIDGLGKSFVGLHDLVAAERVYREAMLRFPNSADLKVRLAYVLSEQDRAKEAMEILCKALPQLKDPIKAIKELSGSSKTRLLSIELSRKILTSDLGLDSARLKPQAALLLAQILSWSPKTRTEAIIHYRSHLKYNPNDQAARREFADLLSWTGKYQESLKIYADLIRQNPNELGLVISQARVSSWNGKLDKAIKMYESVLRQQSANREALIGLAQCQNWSGDHFLAEKTFKQADRYFPNNLEIMVERADNFRKMGRFDQAKKLLLSVISRNEQPETIYVPTKDQ